jgi:hypothetical protein
MCKRAPALPLNELSRKLHPLGFAARDLRALLRDPELLTIADRNSQMFFLSRYIPEQCYISLNDKKLAEIYEISIGNVRKLRFLAKQRNEDNPIHVGKPCTLSKEQENEIVQELLTRAEDDKFLRKGELLDEIERVYGHSFTYRLLSHFPIRHKDELSIATIHPQESLRLEIPRTF